ncbi:GNAT family N-acetyltransferase [Methanoregula sp.]|uniref:GNAT family N-acetyltransferase n=1 Tax=Methanoregula sp. TaxID=2052170 RepID=UPI002CF2B7F4|nr:GNAT family N-acetyltransferase [Methanoregula sp.]HVP95558.1 GNAT family N-acetyltransferase [Methanoregula sp.]
MTAEDIRVSCVRSWSTEEVVALYRAGGWWKDEYDPAEIPRLISGSFAFAVAIDTRSGHAIGMGRVLSDGVSDAYIQDLVVLPEYRGRDLGTALVSCLIARCREAGITWIALIAEPGSEAFYHPLGFARMEGHIPLIYRGAPG